MRIWIRLTHREHCGECGQELPEGSSALEIILRGVKRKRFRGECCAGQAPPNLPESPVLEKLPPLDLSRLAALIPESRTRGALKSMAREYLPHPDD